MDPSNDIDTQYFQFSDEEDTADYINEVMSKKFDEILHRKRLF